MESEVTGPVGRSEEWGSECVQASGRRIKTSKCCFGSQPLARFQCSLADDMSSVLTSCLSWLDGQESCVCFPTDTDHTVKRAVVMNGKYLLLWDHEGADLLILMFCNQCNQHSKKDFLRTG